MDLRKAFGTNRTAEESGVWVPLDGRARVLVGRKTSPAYRKKLQDTIRPYRGAIAANALSDAQSHALFAKAAAGTLLLGWEDFELDGKSLGYSVENAERVMVDLPDFYRAIDSFADDAALFRDQADTAEQKN